MLALFESLAILVLVVLSLGGFTAAVVWTFAVWFDHN